MTNSRKSPFNAGQASRVRINATELYQIYLKLQKPYEDDPDEDTWWFHGQAEAQVEDWDRSALRRLNRSSLIKQKEADKQDQKKWKVPRKVIDYIEEKNYVEDVE